MKTKICKSGSSNLKSLVKLQRVWREALYLKLVLDNFFPEEVTFSTFPFVVTFLEKKKKKLDKDD